MTSILYILISIPSILGAGYFSLRILDWIKQWRNERYKGNTQHFLSDLFKLRSKWAGMGEAAFAESLDNLIKFHGLITKEPKIGGVGLPITNDALSTDVQLRNGRKKELIDTLNEWIDEY